MSKREKTINEMETDGTTMTTNTDNTKRPLDCTDIQAMLSALVDDEIAADRRHDAERHLMQCESCRDLLDEAERMDALVSADAALLAGEQGKSLSADFENAVLMQTVRLSDTPYGRRFTTWLGWTVAAAALALAATIWIMDRQALIQRDINPNVIAQQPDAASPGGPMSNASFTSRSWTYEGARPVSDWRRVADRALLDTTQSANAAVSKIDQFPIVGELPMDDEGEEEPVVRNTRPEPAPLSPVTQDTLQATALVMQQIEHASVNSYVDVERIRRIAEYDELPQRLAIAREEVPVHQQPAVMAAESVLLRIIRGPLDLEDLRLLKKDVQGLKLADQLESISNLGVDNPL